MYKEKASDLPYVTTLWFAEATKDERYDDPAKATWSISFSHLANGSYSAEIIGPNYGYRRGFARTGDKYWGAELSPLVSIQGMDKHAYTDKFVQLPVKNKSFMIGGQVFTVPTYQELEEFLTKLKSNGILVLKEKSLKYQSTMSARSKQRGHKRIVGLTGKQLEQIKRAEKAARLLKQGCPPAEAAERAGYADQPHMTRALKFLLGKTPSQL